MLHTDHVGTLRLSMAIWIIRLILKYYAHVDAYVAGIGCSWRLQTCVLRQKSVLSNFKA